MRTASSFSKRSNAIRAKTGSRSWSRRPSSPGLKDDVRQASLVIAQKVKGDRSAVRQALAEIGVKPVKIEIVKAEYGAGNSQRDVTETAEERRR